MRQRFGSAVVAVSVVGLLAGCAQTIDGRPAGSAAPRTSAAAPTGSVSTGSEPTGFPATTSAPPITSAAPPTTSAPTTTAPTSSAPSTWRTVKDARTGISFPLPGTPKISTSFSTADDGTRLRNVTYTYLDTGSESGIIVGVTTGATQRIRANRNKFGGIGRSLIKRLKSEGSTDAVVLQQMRRTVHGRSALSYRFRYTPTDTSEGQPAWRVTEIDAGSALVSTQVVDFPVPGAEAQALAESLSTENTLLAGLSFG